MKGTTKRLMSFVLTTIFLLGALPLIGSGANPGNFEISAEKSQPLKTHYGIGSHPAATGEYTNEIQMVFMGMEDPENREPEENVTVKMNISDERNDIIQENVTTQELCSSCGITYVTFDWTPTREGTYYINMSYNCTDFGEIIYYPGENLTVIIANVTSYIAEIIISDRPLQEDDYLTAWIIVNNTGNQIIEFKYSINVTKIGGWDYGEQISTGLLEHVYDMDEHNYTLTLLMEKGGDYTINSVKV